MNLMFELSVLEANVLPDFAGTDEFFVSVTLNGLILDKEMLSVIRRISEKDSEILSTEDFLTINALYHGQTLDRKMQDRLSRLTDMGIAEHIGRKKICPCQKPVCSDWKSGYTYKARWLGSRYEQRIASETYSREQ